jgi:diacylglycerol kinase
MMLFPPSSRPVGLEEAPAPLRSRRPWRDKLRTAGRGIKLGVRGHSSFFGYFFTAVLMLAAAVVLHCNLIEWCLLLGCIGLVLTTELFNSALETLFRGLDEESKARAGACLDIAAGGVLLAGITAGVVSGLLFLSRLIDTCAPLFQSRQ